MFGLDPSLLADQILFEAWLGLICAFVVAAVLVFVVVAVWLYRDAMSPGMNAGLWVVLLILASIFFSFVGGIIVLVIYLLVRSSHPIGGYAYGYGPVPAYPSYPGYPMPPPQPPASATPVAPTTCRSCGAPLAPGAAFCAHCGARV